MRRKLVVEEVADESVEYVDVETRPIRSVFCVCVAGEQANGRYLLGLDVEKAQQLFFVIRTQNEKHTF